MEFPANSKKSTLQQQKDTPKREKDKLEKVTTGEVVQKKRPISRRFKDIFFSGEIHSAARYVASDVLLPALRNLVVDATTKGIESVIYGESSPSRRRAQNNSRINYGGSPLAPRRGLSMTLPDQGPRALHRREEVSDIVLVSREDAELVCERLIACVDKYEVASVADFHELVGLPSTYTDNNWGWTNLARIDIRQTREGYLIVLPSPEPI